MHHELSILYHWTYSHVTDVRGLLIGSCVLYMLDHSKSGLDPLHVATLHASMTLVPSAARPEAGPGFPPLSYVFSWKAAAGSMDAAPPDSRSSSSCRVFPELHDRLDRHPTGRVSCQLG